MRKLKEVLRLHSLGLSQHQIARSCSISQSTVHEYLSAAEDGVLFSGHDDEALPLPQLVEATLRMSKLGLIDIVLGGLALARSLRRVGQSGPIPSPPPPAE